MSYKFILVLFCSNLLQIVYGQVCGPLDPTFGKKGRAIGSPPEYRLQSIECNTLVTSENKILQVSPVINDMVNGAGIIRFYSNGQIDSAFGINGFLFIELLNYRFYPTSAAILPDDKILISGYTISKNNETDFTLLRLNKDGIIDSSFANKGTAITPVGNYQDRAYDMVVQPDEKIILVGHSLIDNDTYAWSMVRYLNTGVVDSTFGIHGKFSTDSNYVSPFQGNFRFPSYTKTILQKDGKIIISGARDANKKCVEDGGSIYCSPEAVILRLLPEGRPDYSFGSFGLVIDSIALNIIRDLAVQPDGKLVVTGKGNLGGFITCRYLSNGKLDSSFNQDGVVNYLSEESIQGTYGSNRLFIQEDNKLLIAGNHAFEMQSDLVLIRYTPDGQINNIYGPDSIIRIFALGFYSFDFLSSIFKLDGKLILAGTNGDDLGLRYQLLRLLDFIPTPVIHEANRTLITDSIYIKYQWQLNGKVVPNSDNYIYKPTESGLYKVTGTNQDGCSKTSEEFNFIVTAYEESAFSKINLRYYPNPITDILNIELSDLNGRTEARSKGELNSPSFFNSNNGTVLEASIQDIHGRKLIGQKLHLNTNQISVHHLPAGVYQLLIHHNQEFITKKVIKLN